MDPKRNWFERPIHPLLPSLTNEIALFIVVLLLAVATRFYDLESRVMSHDESLHTYFSWLLYRGQGYEHSPMMHGPFQFHILALTYFLFGSSDLTSRIPSVLFSIGTVWMVWYWRRYLGKWGALIAGFLLVISPYMLYYGRYVRNESFVGFSGILMLYAMLRHLEVGGKKYLLTLAAALALHFTSKETSFIYTAEALIFLAVYFLAQITRRPWQYAEQDYRSFIICLSITILLVGAAVGYGLFSHDTGTLSITETAVPSNPTDSQQPPPSPETAPPSLTVFLAMGALTSLSATAYWLIRGYGWERIRTNRAFELMIVAGTIVLPQLSPFLLKIFENSLHVTIPTSAGEMQALGSDMHSILIIGGFLLLTFLLSIAAGLIWNREKWWKTALVFWAPFTFLYTTIFTNSSGFFTGTIGSLGYWIVQQDVERGSQPWYYYSLIQIPMYEYLPALGFLLALVIGLRRKPAGLPKSVLENASETLNDQPGMMIRVIENPDEPAEIPPVSNEVNSVEANFINTFSLLAWWSMISIVAFSYAGERMPWLTYHITLPMILITGWALGHLIDTTDWKKVQGKNALLTFSVFTIFITSGFGTILSLAGTTLPFQGQTLEQLQATSAFLLPFVVSILSAAGLIYLLRKWSGNEISRVSVLLLFSLLAILTIRASFRAAYITYDQASEFLVYAHGATGIKDIIHQAEEISQRTTGGMGVALAYDASAPDTGVSWPFVWYLRDFTNQRSFDQPTRSLRDSVVIIVDEKNFDKIEPAIGPGYYRVDYIRMWWPMQDYFTLVMDREPNQPFPQDYSCKGALSLLKLHKSKDYSLFCRSFTDPAIRAGIVQIWLNRDYTQYATALGRMDLTLSTWQPADKMRLYIRQDVASQIWNYGVAPVAPETIVDPTEGKFISLPADLIFDSTKAGPIPLNGPRALAFAKEGSVYVTDSYNHRVVHFDATGQVLHTWGTFADGVNTPIGNGTFNELWGIAVGPDGSVYVTDTWNHRVQKFSADGRFLNAWGYFGQGEAPDAFYGPRGLAVDAKGRVYVTDTGNKRIVVFDANGNFITQFGGAGFDPGQFDEPVGVAIDKNGTVYVTDTWNQRIQTFVPVELDDSLSFIPDQQWDVFGWFGQSLENKPFITVNNDLHVFITDPEGYRVMEFSPTGEILRTWGEYGEEYSNFGLASGIAVDREGHLWVADGAFNRLMRFTLPE